NKIPGEIKPENIIYMKNENNIFMPFYFVLDYLDEPYNTLKSLFQYLQSNLLRAKDTQILLGFYGAMKLDSMTDDEIILKVLTIDDIAHESVVDVVDIIENGRAITWIESPDESTEVKFTARRAIQKSLIEGSYGLENLLRHKLFPGMEEEIIINSITGRFWYANDVRDYYKITLDTNRGERPAVIGISNDERVASAQIIRENFDAMKNALIEIDPELGTRFLGGMKNLELKDYYNSVVYRDIIVEEYLENSFLAGDAFPDFGKYPVESPERLSLLESQAYVYANLYSATKSAVLGKSNCIFTYPSEVLFNEVIKGEYNAHALDFYNIEAGKTPGEVIDHYFNKAPEYQVYPERLLKPFENILGRTFLAEAALTSTFTDKINVYLSAGPEPGSINDILNSLGDSMDALGFAGLRDLLLNNLLGRAINIDNNIYTFPKELTTVADYEKFYDIMDILLGPLAYVGEARAYSEEDVAKAMTIALHIVDTPSAFEMSILNIVGIQTVDDLLYVLDNYPAVIEPEGYTLTPKKIMALFGLGRRGPIDDEFLFAVVVENVLFDKSIIPAPVQPQPLTEMFLTESDYKELLLVFKAKGYMSPRLGLQLAALHTVVSSDPSTRLHELTHAQLYARLDAVVKETLTVYGLIELMFLTYNGEIVDYYEGHAQNGLIRKLDIIDKGCGEILDEYKVWGDLGLFGILSRAVNKYRDISVDKVTWLADNHLYLLINGSFYAEEFKTYLAAAQKYAELTGGDDFLFEYLKAYLLSRGTLLIDEFFDTFVSDAVEPIAGPVKFIFGVDGSITVEGSAGRIETISRAVFKEWYCEGNELYEFSAGAGGYIDLSDSIDVSYMIGATLITLKLPAIIFVNELGVYPYYFIYQPDKVTMYHEGVELGYAKFSLEADGEDLWIKELVTYHAALSQTVYGESEAARALIINAYKLSSETIKRIIFADSLLMVDDPALSAYESLSPEGNGYLGILAFDIDYPDCKAVNVLETGMENALYTVMPEAAPIVNGNTKLVFEADDPADPTDSGPVTIINVDPGTGAIVKTAVERPLFRQWYCDTLAKFTIKGVTLDLSDKVEVPMHLGDTVYSLRPEFAINFSDVSATAVFVQTPSSVESYYKMSLDFTSTTGMKTGRVEFHLSADNSEILIDDITVADGLYKLVEKNMVQSL
ncbi:MAG: hypothetical protein KAI03_06420, partial [Candidatus Aureabacteria bacterium]|nr:hypothetical protein [Candidatus Auribacterota bacterium]